MQTKVMFAGIDFEQDRGKSEGEVASRLKRYKK